MSKVLAALAVVLGIILAGLRLISIGAKQATDKADRAVLKTQIKIKEALHKTEKTNREETKDAIDKANAGDFSGFNRRMLDDNDKT